MADEFVKLQVSSNKVVVFSKSYCPYCKKAKAAIKDAGLSEFYVIELDERDDGDAIQDALLKITGARSVPRVFIGGKFVGGGDDVKRLSDQGKLQPMLQAAGAL